MDGKTSEERAREAIEALPRGISDPLLLQIVHKHKILRAFHHYHCALNEFQTSFKPFQTTFEILT